MRYTFGIATRDDRMVWMTVHSALEHHRFLRDDCEVLVVDNSPRGSVLASELERHLRNVKVDVRLVRQPGDESSCLWKQRLFEEARGDVVSSCDSHVMFEQGGLLAALEWCESHPTDLVMGPCLSGVDTVHGTNQVIYESEGYPQPKDSEVRHGVVCRGGAIGCWVKDPRGLDRDGEPYEIMQQGTGFFMMRRDAWPGFHPKMRGFGGNETYLMEKVRSRGGRVWCHPRARWLHCFLRERAPYKVRFEDRIRNYLVGFAELGRWDLYEAACEHLSAAANPQMVASARRATPNPLGWESLSRDWPHADAGALPRSLLSRLASRVRRGERTLELGSGLSTLLFDRAGADHVAVEHSPKFAALVRERLRGSTRLVEAPLAEDGWYGWRPGEDDGGRSLVLVDGPPQRNRSLVERVMPSLLAPGATIYIDDTNRPEEAGLAERLEVTLDARRERVHEGKRAFDVLLTPRR